MTDSRALRILVAGDILREIRVFQGSRTRPSDFMSPGTRTVTEIGNAGFLQRLIESAFADPKPVAPAADKNSAGPPSVRIFSGVSAEGLDSLPSFLQSHEVWRPFPGADGKVWRLAERLGYGWKAHDVSSDGAYEKLPDVTALRAPYDMVVLDDAGLLYRHAPQQACWPAFLNEKRDPAPRTIVLKTTSPLAAGDLWRALERHAERLVVVVDIEDLRREEARITRGASWERTALDLLRELRENPSLHPLLQCRHLVVRIGLEGAFHVTCFQGRVEKAQLFFDPGYMENDWHLHEGIDGVVFGATSCLTAGLVRQLSVEDNPTSLQSGVIAGMAAARHLLLFGLGRVDEDQLPSPDLPGIGKLLQVNDRKSGLFLAGVDIPLQGQKADDWTIIAANHAAAEKKGMPLFGVATKLALAGPSFLVDAPKQRFGKVVTVDRGEIESLRSVRGLMQGYRASGESKPLSIGVFGPPGAGKSFAVKEIAKGVFGDKVPLLEFNLSQFEGPSDLIGALHQVRDFAIRAAPGVGGDSPMPVVFWDEFDSRDYFWLQYLLAPMQGGKFLEGQITHPVGRAVFVFAGGTSSEFETFGPPESDQSEVRAFKSKKGPDFKSRLSGYLNILGPNQRKQRGSEDPDANDICFPVRRAFLLRAMFGVKHDELLDMDRGLLLALLEVKKYEHGSRSVEKIAYLLKNHGKRGSLRRSDLPTAEVVSLHVELGEIEELCRRDFAFRFNAPKLAPAFHRFYRDLCKRNGWEFKYDMDYEQLPDEIKSDNIAAAQRLPFILSLAPLWLIPEGSEAIPIKRGQDVIQSRLEILAEAEHDGWMEHKLRNGWRQGARNDAKRIHDVLVPYRRLTETEKKKDRENVLRYPEIVALAGYGLSDKKPGQR